MRAEFSICWQTLFTSNIHAAMLVTPMFFQSYNNLIPTALNLTNFAQLLSKLHQQRQRASQIDAAQ